MKKLISVMIVGLVLPIAASAHNVYNADNTAVVSVIPDDIYNEIIARSQRSGQNLPRIASGASVTDEHGVVDTCPWFYGMFGCVDLTKTPEYHTYMTNLAKDLIAKGAANQYPIFKGWIDSVK